MFRMRYALNLLQMLHVGDGCYSFRCGESFARCRSPRVLIVDIVIDDVVVVVVVDMGSEAER